MTSHSTVQSIVKNFLTKVFKIYIFLLGHSSSSGHYGSSGSSGYHVSSSSSGYYESSGSSNHYGSSGSSDDRSSGLSSHDGSSRLFENDSPSSFQTTTKKMSHIIPVVHSHPYHHTAYSHGSSNQVSEQVESTTSSVTNEPIDQNNANYPSFDLSPSLSDPTADMLKILKQLTDEDKSAELRKNLTSSSSITRSTMNIPESENHKLKTKDKIEPTQSNLTTTSLESDDVLNAMKKVINAIGLDLKFNNQLV